MLHKTMVGAVCFGIALCTNAQAVELTGGSLDLGYSAYVDDTDFSRLALRGQAEIGFNRNFALQIDAGGYNFNLLDETGTNIGLHAIYHVNDTVSFGAFYSRDDVSIIDADTYGLEAGFELSNQVSAEVYVATGDLQGADTTAFGLELSLAAGDRFELGLDVDHLDLESAADGTRLSIGVEYQFADQANVYAQFGNEEANLGSLGGSEPFFGVGLRIDFGAARGATFGQRGLLELVTGF